MSDSDVLHAYLTENAQPDGTYRQNLRVAAATIGWSPDHLITVMQALVADGRVEAAHEGGDATRISGSEWRLVADEDVEETDVSKMTGKQLKAYADANDIELPEGKLSVADLRDYVQEAIDEKSADA